jgi:hypothetical protein
LAVEVSVPAAAGGAAPSGQPRSGDYLASSVGLWAANHGRQRAVSAMHHGAGFPLPLGGSFWALSAINCHLTWPCTNETNPCFTTATHQDQDYNQPAMDSKPSAEGLRERHKAGSVGEPSSDSSPTRPKIHAQVAAAQVQDVLSLLLLFRFINALCVRTFFQPDEYFQALEPAWSIAFGGDSGAWLTWVHLPILIPSTLRSMCEVTDTLHQPRNGNTSCGHRSIRPSLVWRTRLSMEPWPSCTSSRRSGPLC